MALVNVRAKGLLEEEMRRGEVVEEEELDEEEEGSDEVMTQLKTVWEPVVDSLYVW